MGTITNSYICYVLNYIGVYVIKGIKNVCPCIVPNSGTCSSVLSFHPPAAYAEFPSHWVACQQQPHPLTCGVFSEWLIGTISWEIRSSDQRVNLKWPGRFLNWTGAFASDLCLFDWLGAQLSLLGMHAKLFQMHEQTVFTIVQENSVIASLI